MEDAKIGAVRAVIARRRVQHIGRHGAGDHLRPALSQSVQEPGTCDEACGGSYRPCRGQEAEHKVGPNAGRNEDG